MIYFRVFPSDSFRVFPRVGHGVGQAVDPHFDPHFFQRFYNKKAPKTEVFDAFCHVLIKKIHSQSIAPQGFAAFL